MNDFQKLSINAPQLVLYKSSISNENILYFKCALFGLDSLEY